MSDDYAYWRRALEGDFGPVHIDDPQCGFYRSKVLPGRDSPWTPIAIWRDSVSGEVVAMKHMYVVEQPLLVPSDEIWLWCADSPISEKAYRAVAEHKQPWPSEKYPKRKRNT